MRIRLGVELLLMLPCLASPAQTVGTSPAMIIAEHELLNTRFRAGDTNSPALVMDWYSRGGHMCRVERSGKVLSAFSGFSSFTTPNKGQLDSTNQLLLAQAIDVLPQSKAPVTAERQIHVSGIRSNQWFHFVYDRGRIPKEVRKLYEITGAPIKSTSETVD